MTPPSYTEGSVQRGTKRKRAPGKRTRSAPAVKRPSPGELVAKKLHHGLSEVRKAAKKAAVFELRKLVKRLKAARGEKPSKGDAKGDDATELERQLEVLKHIDHEPFANTALKTKILKDRILSENDDVKNAVAKKLSENLVQPQQPGSSAAKVHGRLLSSKIIADAVHAVVTPLREIVDPSLAKAKTDIGVRGAASGESEDESSEAQEEDAGSARRTVAVKKARLAASDEDGDEGEEAEEESDVGVEVTADGAGWESGTVDGDDDGAGWESGSVDGGGPVAADEEGGETEDGDDDDSEDNTDSDAGLLVQKPKAKPPANEAKGKAKATGESTFLPSLSVGFTRGDSDASDLSDADAEAAAADLPRKNRRGQRARRAIWEKKYGKNANHVKKQHDGSGGRGANKGDPRERNGKTRAQGPGSHDRPERPGASTRSGYGHGAGADARGAPPPPPVDGGWPKRRDAGAGAKKGDDKPLHPSWEAKKRLKEKLNPSIIPAQGKKITFS
ncbi:Bud-site selection protein [Trametes meyenii]|nr:Bud-site selection protein [Trametes meyenii]